MRWKTAVNKNRGEKMNSMNSIEAQWLRIIYKNTNQWLMNIHRN